MATKDDLWKGIVEDFFEDLMRFFYPQHVDMLDFNKVVFLDKEFQQLFPEEQGHTKRADRLVKVGLKDGSEIWQLIHIEVQGYEDQDFPERMFKYYYRTYDKFKQPLAALVILSDPQPSYHPQQFMAESLRTRMTYQFHTYKLLDQDEGKLAEEENPFALALLTALEFLRAGRLDDASLFQLKVRLFRKLLERGYDKLQIDRLTSFIKYYVGFASRDMNVKFDEATLKISNSKVPMGIIETILSEAKQEEKDRLTHDYVAKLLVNGLPTEQISQFLELPLAYVAGVEEKLRAEGKLK